MSTHPYIPLYVDDFEAATTHLSIEEDGVYNRLLRLCWRTPGCSLPDDPVWIARKIRISPEDFERLAKPILAEFFACVRGRFVQRRLKREYDDISRKKTARKLAGKKGGAAKSANAKGKSASNANDLPAHARAFPYPEPEPKPDSSEDKSSGAAGAVPDLDAETWRCGVSLLMAQGKATEPQARRFLGRLISANGLEARDLLPAVSAALVNRTGDPQGYLTKSAASIAKRRAGQPEKRVDFV